MKLTNENRVLKMFYHLLWMKDSLFNEEDFKINLPHTIIINNHMPVFWFFSDENGIIKKKKRKNISISSIKQKFLKNLSRGNIVASYIYYNSDKTKFLIDYLDTDSFNEFFLEKTKKSPEGVLQRFVDSQEKNHCKQFLLFFDSSFIGLGVIESVWSKEITLYSKRINFHNIADLTKNCYERCVTYDGPESMSKLVHFGNGILSSIVQGLTISIAEHIKTISYEMVKIKGIILYYKISRTQFEEKIYLLYCSSIKLEDSSDYFPKKPNVDKELLNLDRLVTIPDSFNITYSQSKKRNTLAKKEIICLNCSENQCPGKFAEIKYKFIISTYEKDNKIYPMRKDNHELISEYDHEAFKLFNNYENYLVSDYFKPEHQIPPYFRKVYNHFTLEEYKKLKVNNNFLNKKAMVCWNCYLAIMEKLKIGGKQKPDVSTSKNKINYLNREGLEIARLNLIDRKKREQKIFSSFHTIRTEPDGTEKNEKKFEFSAKTSIFTLNSTKSSMIDGSFKISTLPKQHQVINAKNVISKNRNLESHLSLKGESTTSNNCQPSVNLLIRPKLYRIKLNSLHGNETNSQTQISTEIDTSSANRNVEKLTSENTNKFTDYSTDEDNFHNKIFTPRPSNLNLGNTNESMTKKFNSEELKFDFILNTESDNKNDQPLIEELSEDEDGDEQTSTITIILLNKKFFFKMNYQHLQQNLKKQFQVYEKNQKKDQHKIFKLLQQQFFCTF